MLPGIEQAILAKTPDAVLVYGDTNSTLAGALAAAKLRISGGACRGWASHVRPFDAEELNRIRVDHLSALLFSPVTPRSRICGGRGSSRVSARWAT